jgi:cytoskeletal protein CcmA (bactofilin family)
LDDPTAANPKARSTSTTTYTVTVTDANGCTDPDGMTVTVHDFIFLTDDRIKIDGNGPFVSEGNMHTNNDIEFHKGKPGTHIGNFSAVRDITIGPQNTITGDAIAGDELFLQGNAQVTGTKDDHANVAAIPLPPLPTFTAGGQDFDVPKKGRLTLAPGAYGRVKLRKKSELFLSSGDYFFKDLDTDRRVALHLNVSGGPINIHVDRELEFDARVEMIVTPGGEDASEEISIFARQSVALDIGKYCRIIGAIMLPNAEVHFSKGCSFRGSICAQSVTVEDGVPFQHHSATTPLPKPVPEDSIQYSDDSIQLTVDSYELMQNYPNPFNPSTVIRFQLPRWHRGKVKLAIYSMTGQVVRTLASGEFTSGSHLVVWDATDDSGARVASGVYVYRITAGSFVSQRKLVLMK